MNNAGEQHRGRASAFQAEDRGVRLSSPAPDIHNFSNYMENYGWYIFPEFISPELVEELKSDLMLSYAACRKVQIKKGVEMSGAGHHILPLAPSFLKYLLEFEALDPYMEAYFGGKYIINNFGGNILEGGMSYASHIHRDIRSFSGELPLLMNTMVMLDDFTNENGATWLMMNGHKRPHKPSDKEFEELGFQVTGKAGSIVCFNSNMWHKAGDNKTEKSRMALTPAFSRPFYKPQFDYARAFEDVALSPYLSQLVGINSRIPTTLEEWYQANEEDRFYRSNQG